MTSDFAPEVAKYPPPQSILATIKYTYIHMPQQQFRECASLMFRSVSDAACFEHVKFVIFVGDSL